LGKKIDDDIDEGHGDSSVVMMGVRSNMIHAATTTDQAKTTPGLLRQTLILATGSRNPRYISEQ